MRKPSTDLYDLVHSLSSQEARHFKRTLRLQESNAVKLFVGLQQAAAYDEARLQREVMPEANANQFAVAKHYLYQAVVLFLLQREQQAGGAWQIRTRLQVLEVLYKKELFGQCESLLQSIERAVRQLDDPSLLREVLVWHLKLADRKNHDVSSEEFEALGLEFLGNAQKELELTRQHWNYHDFFFRLRKKGVLASAASIETDYQSLFAGGMGTNEPQASLASQLSFAQAYATYAFMRGQVHEAYETHRWIGQAMEQSVGWVVLRPDIYLDSMFRVGLMAIEEARFDEARLIIGKISKLQQQDAQEGRRFFYKTQLERAMHLLRGEWATLGAMVERLEEAFEAHHYRMNPSETAVFRFNNAMAFLSLEQYAAAKRRLHDLLNTDVLREQRDFEIASKLLMLLIAEQERDKTQFQFWYRSLYRQLQKQKGGHQMEELIIKGLRHIFVAKTQRLKAMAWQDLHTAISQGQHVGSRAIHYFDFQSWMRARAESKSFETVFKERLAAEIASKRQEARGD